MPITRINTFEAEDGQADELREFLASIIDLIVGAPGCQSVELLVARDEPRRLAIVEEWASIDAHRSAASRIPSDLFQKALALFASPPAGTYYDSQMRKTAPGSASGAST